MVLILHKKNEEDQFLIEVKLTNSIGEIIFKLVEIQNARARLRLLSSEIEKFLNPTNHNSSCENNNNNGKTDNSTEKTKEEILLNITEKQKELLSRSISEAKAILAKIQVERKVLASLEELNSCFYDLKELIKQINPEGFPETHPISKTILEDEVTGMQLEGTYDSESAVLWWAGKELLREEKLIKYIGHNEKTKLIVKLQKKDQGLPFRDLSRTSEQQREMLSYYYRKSQEQKKLEEDIDDSYLNSKWTDTKSLKNYFGGLDSIHWKVPDQY